MPPNSLENNAPFNQNQPLMPAPAVPPVPVANAAPVINPTAAPVAASAAWAAPVSNPMVAQPAQPWATPITNPVPPFATPQTVMATPTTTGSLSPPDLKTITSAGLVTFIIGWIDLAVFILLALLAVAPAANRTSLLIGAVPMGVAGLTYVILGYKLKKYSPLSSLNVKQTLIILTVVNIAIIAGAIFTGGNAGLLNILLMFFLGRALKVVSSPKTN